MFNLAEIKVGGVKSPFFFYRKKLLTITNEWCNIIDERRTEMRNVTTISICLPHDLADKIKENAKKENRSISNYLTYLLRAILES